mmetsp:Transcript_54293/g.172389  ORF Transcript_54293/g.172389 Transcript_54293/m.172389 type:complete len:259 (+) Transcript_54293:1110-1886(+)
MVRLEVRFLSDVYRVGEVVEGMVVIDCGASGALKHRGVRIAGTGALTTHLQQGGMVAASTRRVVLLAVDVEVVPAGRVSGVQALPFSFPLRPLPGGPPLYETYHGEHLSVQYGVRVEVSRSALLGSLSTSTEFVVRAPGAPFGGVIGLDEPSGDHRTAAFVLEPDTLLKKVRPLAAFLRAIGFCITAVTCYFRRGEDGEAGVRREKAARGCGASIPHPPPHAPACCCYTACLLRIIGCAVSLLVSPSRVALPYGPATF